MVLSHQKSKICASMFYLIFMFFPTPLPEGIFRGSKCPSILKSTILERSAISWRAENGPINPNNISKSHLKSKNFRPGSVLEPTWARFGAENAPRTHFHRYGIVFCSILEGFSNNFKSMFNATFQNVNPVLRQTL